jgi:deoxyhypusine synthase
VSRGHGKNKLFNVWLSEDDYRKFEEFLDKFSAGDSFSDRSRSFIHWLGEQTEGIDRAR